MSVKKDNQKWNIIHIPASETHLCNECGIKLGSKIAFNRHKTYQHVDYKLICPECNYSTTRKDNMRHHLINRHKLRKVGIAIDNLQCIQTEQKNAKIRAKAPLSAPIHNTDKLKQIKKKSTTSYVYAETLPKNRKLYSWTLDELAKEAPSTMKKFITKPVTIPLKRHASITSQPVRKTEYIPKHIDDELADLSWLPEATYPDSKQDKQINTPVLDCTPIQEWITIDQLENPESIDYNIQAV